MEKAESVPEVPFEGAYHEATGRAAVKTQGRLPVLITLTSKLAVSPGFMFPIFRDTLVGASGASTIVPAAKFAPVVAVDVKFAATPMPTTVARRPISNSEMSIFFNLSSLP